MGEIKSFHGKFQKCGRSVPRNRLISLQLSLTDDIELFKKAVNEASTRGNVDSPESGLEALMQAVSCDDIGWSAEQFRRVVVLITDKVLLERVLQNTYTSDDKTSLI